MEAGLLVDGTSELMALAIAAHEEVLKTHPNRTEGAEYLIDAARLVTLAVLKLVSVVENDEGNEAIGAAATCLKVSSPESSFSQQYQCCLTHSPLFFFFRCLRVP